MPLFGSKMHVHDCFCYCWLICNLQLKVTLRVACQLIIKCKFLVLGQAQLWLRICPSDAQSIDHSHFFCILHFFFLINNVTKSINQSHTVMRSREWLIIVFTINVYIVIYIFFKKEIFNLSLSIYLLKLMTPSLIVHSKIFMYGPFDLKVALIM